MDNKFVLKLRCRQVYPKLLPIIVLNRIEQNFVPGNTQETQKNEKKKKKKKTHKKTIFFSLFCMSCPNVKAVGTKLQSSNIARMQRSVYFDTFVLLDIWQTCSECSDSTKINSMRLGT